VDAKGRHALKKADSDGHGNLQVRLLQPVPEARVKYLDSSCGFRHSLLHLCLNVFLAKAVPEAGFRLRGIHLLGLRGTLQNTMTGKQHGFIGLAVGIHCICSRSLLQSSRKDAPGGIL
jgi:hypothetical protein